MLEKKFKNLREGQVIFNFLEWLRETYLTDSSQSNRMADPFHVSNKKLEFYWKEYLKIIKDD